MSVQVLSRRGILLLLAAMAPSLAHASWSHDPSQNNPVFVSASNYGAAPVAVSDGAGGVISVFYTSGSAYDLRIQRLNAQGDPMWGTNGVLFCTAAGEQIQYAMVPDGAGGVIVAWSDRRVAPGDMYAQRINASGVAQWTADGVGVCAAAGDQYYHQIATDGLGGALVTWHDNRGGTLDIYAARVTSAGALPWTANGVAVSAAAAEQWFPKIASDGANGAFIIWTDRRNGTDDVYGQHVISWGSPFWTANGVALASGAGDQSVSSVLADGFGGVFTGFSNSASGNQELYMHRVNSGGVLYWGSSGVILCAAAGNQYGAKLVADGENGVMAAWSDVRTGQVDIYAGRITGDGVVLSPASGVPVCVAGGNQTDLNLISDDRGGAIAAWADARGTYSQVYAQRIDHQVALGDASPVIASVRDVPNDEGGQLKISWYASYLDTEIPYEVTEYWVLRSVPYNSVQALLESGATIGNDGPGLPSRAGRRYLMTTTATTTWFWELLATQPAFHSAGYSLVAPTTSDSVPGSNPFTVFMIRARNADTDQWWDSSPDSGYSVDNLSPAAPSGFTAQYFGGSPPSQLGTKSVASGFTWLHWRPNTEPDFLEYRLHRGASADFVPELGNLLAAQPDTGFIDDGPPGGYYKLLAWDTHDNVSSSALLTPNDVSGVAGPEPPSRPWLAPASPQPVVESTSLQFGLPRTTHVTLAIYDARGRRVRELIAGSLPAGDHAANWNTLDDGGSRVASGMYFLRFEAEGEVRTQRVAVTR